MRADDLVLLTGATGYVGSRLLGVLRQSGHRLRLLVRKPAALAPDLERGSRLEVVTGDLLDPRSVQHAMTGVHSTYYLVHTMDVEGEFEKRDRQSAANFAAAAGAAGVARIIYLGGLGARQRSPAAASAWTSPARPQNGPPGARHKHNDPLWGDLASE